jgi:signal transduction histidine kinase
MLLRAVGERVEVVVDAAPTAEIAVDVGQLGQVLLNLAVNARDAMPDGGTLSIRVADVATPVVRALHPDAAGEGYVAISVADTGTGMDAATAARVFDPYFTTKQPGRGTGLGLSQVHGIVRQHGGFVDLHTQRGRGTTITLLFPAATRPAVAAAPEVRALDYACARAS